ncbi:MAG TPA: NADP-dependent oxidoreductase [Acidimicrobiia bacterium]
MTSVNHQILLAKRPDGPVDADCFVAAESAVPEPGDGEVLVRVDYLSIDPTIRMWMAMDTYLPAIEIGAPIRSAGLGTVIESNNDDIPVGTVLFGTPGWQEYAVMGPKDQVVPEGVDPTAALSIFGITGLTAYFGLMEVGRPKEGQTVVISGAAGATGSVAGQIAKLQGCRVVGIAGSEDKCRWLTEELGFDAAINYRTENVGTALHAACPNGIDVFFDNVGGEILEAALANLALHGRVVMCGAISQYNDATPPPGPRNLSVLISKRGRMEGFIILDFLPRAGEAIAQLATWVMSGQLHYKVDVLDGLAAAPEALRRLFSGENTGKMLVHLT